MIKVAEDVVPDLEVRSHLRVLGRRKWFIVLPVIVLVVSTLIASSLQRPTFQGEAKVLLKQTEVESLFGVTGAPPEDPARRLHTEIEVVKSAPVRSAVESQIGPVDKVEATQVGTTDVISIKGTGPTRRRAAEVTRAYALAYIDFRRIQEVRELETAGRKLQDKIASLQGEIDALDQRSRSGDPRTQSVLAADRDRLVSQQALFKHRLDELQVEAELKTGGANLVTDEVATVQINPTPLRNGVLALVLGFMVTVSLAFALDYLDDTIRTKEELDRALPGIRVLGIIPEIDREATVTGRSVSSLTSPGRPFGEAFRTLRTSIQFLGLQRPPRIIQLTSARAGEGKTTVASHLAAVFARSGQTVVLIDADLRRARLHDRFRLPNHLGFTSLLVDDAEMDQVIQEVHDMRNLSVVTSGPLPMNPSELLGSQTTSQVLAALAERFDVVVIDSPPVLPVTDALALSAWVDATLLVVAAGATSTRDVQRSAELLTDLQAPVAGSVLNRANAQENYGYAYEYIDDNEDRMFGRRLRTRRNRTDAREHAASERTVMPQPRSTTDAPLPSSVVTTGGTNGRDGEVGVDPQQHLS